MLLMLRILSTPWWAPFAAVYFLRRLRDRARRAETPGRTSGLPGPRESRDRLSGGA